MYLKNKYTIIKKISGNALGIVTLQQTSAEMPWLLSLQLRLIELIATMHN